MAKPAYSKSEVDKLSAKLSKAVELLDSVSQQLGELEEVNCD